MENPSTTMAGEISTKKKMSTENICHKCFYEQ